MAHSYRETLQYIKSNNIGLWNNKYSTTYENIKRKKNTQQWIEDTHSEKICLRLK